MHDLIALIERHPLATALLALGSLVGSLVVTIAMLVRLPADYFAGAQPPRWFAARHPAVRAVLHVAHNLVGVVLIALGLVMSVPGVPGQGVLTIVLGLMLTDVPGKHRALRWLIRRAPVRRGADRIRARWGRAPLVVDAPPDQ